jgi:hypothetical protein
MACTGKAEVCLWKTEAMIKASQEQMRAEIRSVLEGMKTIQEKTGRIQAAPQLQTSAALHKDPEWAVCEEATGVT